MYGLEDTRPGARRVQISAGREAHPTRDRRAQIGQYVPEKVVGDDDVEPLRLGHEVQAGRVDVRVVAVDARVHRTELVERPGPQVAGVCQHVRLVHHGQLLARPGVRALERVAENALDAVTRVNRILDCHLSERAAGLDAARARIQTLSVFADDDHVYVVRTLSGERSCDSRTKLHRAQIDVEVQLEAQP